MSQLKLQRPELLEQRCLVGGEWIDGTRTFEVRNPANNEVIASVPHFGRAEVEQAITAAADSAMKARRPGARRPPGPRLVR